MLKKLFFRDMINRKNEETKLYGESNTKQGLPIYVILVSGSGYVSKSIRLYTKAKYSHAALMIRYYETISMGTIKGDGLSIESIMEMIHNGRDGNIKIMRQFVSTNSYTRISKRINFYKHNADKIKYSYGKILRYLPFIPKKDIKDYKDETSFVCTEFVSYILREIRGVSSKLLKDRGRGSKFMVTAEEMSESLSEAFEVVYEGSIKDMPGDFLYKIEKPYDKVKETIDREVVKLFNKPKQYNESDTAIKTSFNTELDSEPLNTAIKRIDDSFILKLSSL